MARPPLPIGERGEINRARRGDGWVASCRYRDADGVTRQVTATGPSGQKAENALKRKLKDRKHGGEEITPETTVAVLAEAWFATVNKRGTTRDTYRGKLDAHIIPRLGKVRLRELTTGRAERFLREVTTGGTKTVTHAKGKVREVRWGGPGAAMSCRSVLILMCSMAVRFDAMGANPIRETTRPEAAVTPAKALSVDAYARLRGNIIAWQEAGSMGPRKERIIDRVDLMIATGCRPGEVLAFQWDDVDFDAIPPTIEVSGTVVRTKARGLHRQELPKSEAGRRVLSLPQFAVTMLKLRKMRQEPGVTLVFPSRKGSVIEPGNFRRQWTAARGEEFAWVKPSSMRKTVATLIEREVGSLIASKQLGHSSDAVTLRHYVERRRNAPDSTEMLERFGKGT